MARDADVPVVPIVVCGTTHVLPKSGFVIRNVQIHATVRVLPAIAPPAEPDVDAHMASVRSVIETNLLELQAASKNGLADA